LAVQKTPLGFTWLLRYTCELYITLDSSWQSNTTIFN
jgi:hypothetical protein